MARDTILVVDDSDINREMLRFIFEGQYQILEARDGEEAMVKIAENIDSLAVVFLDLIMPKKNGLDVLRFMNEKEYIKTLPVIMITGEATPRTDEKAYDYGASDIIYKPFASRIVMRRTKNIIELYANKQEIQEQLDARTKELIESKEKIRKSNEFLVNALSSVVEFRSLESGEHVQRVKDYTRILIHYIMADFPEYGIKEEDIDLIVNAAALHDIGKIAIPDSILLKPGKLTTEEFSEMKKHTVYGCNLLKNFKEEEDDFFRYCYDIVRHHHERFDGRGYPDGLVGDDIPIWAQAVSLADVYDALVSKRVYKDAYAIEEAIDMIERGECGVFSPKLLECFAHAREEFISKTEIKGLDMVM